MPKIEQRDHRRPLDGYVIVTRACRWCKGKGCRRCFGGGLETAEQHFTYADDSGSGTYAEPTNG